MTTTARRRKLSVNEHMVSGLPERYVEQGLGTAGVDTPGMRETLERLPIIRGFPTVPVKRWGKDHWTTLGYIEARCIANAGHVHLPHLRVNPDKHPGMAHTRWSREYGTRVKLLGATLFWHDDIDCIEDMAIVGYVLDGLTGMGHGVVALTDLGKAVAQELRVWKASGKVSHLFVPSDDLIPAIGRD